jgi:hypothetical protein
MLDLRHEMDQLQADLAAMSVIATWGGELANSQIVAARYWF